MKVLIIANGQPPHYSQISDLIEAADYIIAADGGMNYCLNHNITANCLIGDMDSNASFTQDLPPQTKILRISEQISTDMEKALDFARSLNPERIEIIAAFGKRMDHTLGNMLILHNSTIDIPLTMYDEFGKMQVLNAGTHALDTIKGQTVSLFAITPVENIKLSGFRYPLDEKKLGPVFYGVSNVVDNVPATISFTSGKLLIYEVRNQNG